VSSTRVTRRLAASRADVYRALVDADALARWKFPQGMTCEVQPVDGGLRVSLTYEDDRTGKTTARTDTYRSRFVRLVPDEQVVEVDAFETDDPALQGEMTITWSLAEAAGGGTELVATHDDLPVGVSPEDNRLGFEQALDRLADLVEAR
jgi:uncharacterized protein YndB with AHSA1/START domain